MRYLQSATECSLQKTCLTSGCVKYTGWGVGLAYATAITTLNVWMMVSFPGYIDSNGTIDQWYDWVDGLYTNLYLSITSIWSTLTITSTIT